MSTPVVPEKKDYAPPKGAENAYAWTSSTNEKLELKITSEWMVLHKHERPAAEMFYTYYRPAVAKKKRPITFVFNGGPGAASVYLHLGGLGPQRAVFNANGTVPPPPAQLANNTESFIEFSDLVFIDPIGTGFSRVIEHEKSADKDKPDPKKTVDPKEFYAVKRDLESLGEFIERFLSKYKLWDTEVFLAGESYGGFRTAKLARLLQEKHGVGLTGVIAISPALEFTLLSEGDYDVLRSMDTFCTMALAAAHHGRSRVFAKGATIASMRPEIESFATRELAHAFTVGSGHDAKELERVFNRAADFLGMSADSISRAHGRVPFWRFSRELLRDQRLVLGFYDATITATDPFPDRDNSEGLDPTLVGIERVFAGGINQLLRAQIGIETDRRYNLLSYEVFESWSRDNGKHIDGPPVGAVDDLRIAMSLNPYMKVLICHGYYDMVTPYFSTNRLVEQMKLLPIQRANLAVKHFDGGHMFYSWDDSRKQFRDWARTIYS